MESMEEVAQGLRNKVRMLEDLIDRYREAEDEHLQIIKEKDNSIAYWISKAIGQETKIQGGYPHVE